MPFDGTTLPAQAAYLLRGKNYLLEHGWCKDAFSIANAPSCMMLALGRDEAGVDRRSSNTDAYRKAAAIFSYILKLGGKEAGLPDAVGNWNDAPGRTLAEVLDVYDQAIALEINKNG